MSELKPCPFCGGRAFVATVEHSVESRPNGYRFHGQIMCERCQAAAGTTGFDLTYEEATKKATDAWNRRAPTISAAPVHGEWKDSNEYKGWQVCSACRGCYVDKEWVNGKKWRYCPNCGALMDGEREEKG